MEYEVNQVLITPLGGEVDKPLYMYQAHLYVLITLFVIFYLPNFFPKATCHGMPRFPYNATCVPKSPSEGLMV